ncbi:MAG: hypothetical protein RDV41_09240 [Planctomycetota bacterium]|nr:hypothetical protein [Planctomycetota bacterium]
MNRARKVELLVVLGILCCLVALLLPAVLKARHCTKANECTRNLKTLGQLISSYRAKYAGFPPAQGKTFLNTLRNTPTPELSVAGNQHCLFVCPGLGRAPSSTALDYRYSVDPPVRTLTDESRFDEPLCADLPANHVGHHGEVHVLLLDGCVLAAGEGDAPDFCSRELYRLCNSPEILVQEPVQNGE